MSQLHPNRGGKWPPGYNIVRLHEFCGTLSNPLLLLFSCPLWSRFRVTVRDPSMGRREQVHHLRSIIFIWNHRIVCKFSCLNLVEAWWSFRTIVFINGRYILFVELRTTSFIESMRITRFNSVSHNWVHVLSLPVLLLLSGLSP